MAMEIFRVGRGQEGYPERLMPFADMPSRLFVRGALPADEQKTAAIVGARICTAYGKSQAAFFAQVLAANGVAVISGLACGIDAAAHEGALRGKGKTFAVLGCGVDICYPKQNYPLMRRMLENGGGVLSEFPPGAEPLPWHFPIRNRVISALADVVLVIEAKEKSGSLITADYALEQGKTEVGAYEPGSVAEVQITMWNIVYTIPKGSRIRVDVSSSDFPQYHVHSNQKGLWSEKTENKIAHQTIHMGGKAASCVILPLMKKQ